MTISKIAQAAGVSVPTVSKVLNGRADVAPATRAKVEALIDEHQYRRRRRSKTSNGSNGSKMIDLVFHELEGPWAVEIIRGVERVAREERLTVVLSECGAALTPRQEWLEGVLSRKPDGLATSRASSLTPPANQPASCQRSDHRTGAAASPPPATSSSSDTDASVSLVARHECGAAAHASTATERSWKAPTSRSTQP
jgi:DNA-binding LacI/PurR family transcriptional regulator